MILCPHCGYSNEDNNKTCKSCYKPIEINKKKKLLNKSIKEEKPKAKLIERKNNKTLFLIDPSEILQATAKTSVNDSESNVYLTDKRLYIVGKASQGIMNKGYGVTFIEKSSIYGATKTNIRNYMFLVGFVILLVISVSTYLFDSSSSKTLLSVILLIPSLIFLILFNIIKSKSIIVLHQGGEYTINLNNYSEEDFNSFYKSLGK